LKTQQVLLCRPVYAGRRALDQTRLDFLRPRPSRTPARGMPWRSASQRP